MVNGKNGNGLATIVVILGMVVLVVAYITASVVDTTGQVKDTVGVIMVVLTALGLYLQNTQAKQQIQIIHDSTKANDKKLDVIGANVDGLNKAALVNQAIISEAKGKQETLDVVVAIADATGKEKKPPPVAGVSLLKRKR